MALVPRQNLAAGAESPTPPPGGGEHATTGTTSLHNLKIFNGEKRLFGTYGPSTSMGYPKRLQRKFYRYTGKYGTDCPLQISNFSVPGGQWRMPGWIDCKPAKDDPARWEAFRTQHYLNTIQKLIKDNPGTPVIVLAMNNTGYACITNSRIMAPDDTVHINMAANFLRTHIHAILDDGAALYFLSPKKYWRDLDNPHEWNRNEERYALAPVAAENIPGFTYVKGVWEDTAKYKEIALVKDGHHPTALGDEIIASKFFIALLQHDGLPVPAWDQEEVDAVRQDLKAVPWSVPPGASAPGNGVFARSNLLAWCIVPFDTKKRGPEERAQMLEKLGITKLAYDWRAEHIPTFDAEVVATKRHGIDLTAWWFPGDLNTNAWAILDCIKRNAIHPQLWVSLEGGPHLRLDKAFESPPSAQSAHIERMVARVKPIAAEAAKLGCQVALYNHGGWFGIPENQVQIIERLRQDGVTNVGMVYTQHHGHGEIDRFASLFPLMQPYLLALTLNGMTRDADLQSHELGTAPVGQGQEDLRLLRLIRESGWHGPVGIILEVNADAEARLRDNLDGLDWLVRQLDAKPPGPRPTPRSWTRPAAANATKGSH